MVSLGSIYSSLCLSFHVSVCLSVFRSAFLASPCLPGGWSAVQDACWCQTTLLSGLKMTVFLGAYAVMKPPTTRCKKNGFINIYKMTKLAQCTESYQLDGWLTVMLWNGSTHTHTHTHPLTETHSLKHVAQQPSTHVLYKPTWENMHLACGYAHAGREGKFRWFTVCTGRTAGFVSDRTNALWKTCEETQNRLL